VTRRVTVEVFDPASTLANPSYRLSLYRLCTEHTENTVSVVNEVCLPLDCLALDVLLLHASMLRRCVYRLVA
jgi:hypothetical protein